MPPYEFPLRRVLAWRRTQLELEENRLRQMAAAIEELTVTAARIEMAKGRAEQAVCQASAVDATDLWALAAYRARLLAEMAALAARKKAALERLAAQRQTVLEAQRQCRLLEKLEQRRHAEWQREADREMENLAAESFLALWKRRSTDAS